MTKLVIIGGGVMGSIFAKALSSSCQIMVCDKGDDKNVCRAADFILLAVKPQSFAEVAKELRGSLNNQLVISIMAGVKVEKIKSALGVNKIVRAMPNLGARVGKSMTVWTSEGVEDKSEINNLFKQIGESLEVQKEEMIDKATAVSGSGPGFFFYLVSEWTKAATELGFSEAEAKFLLLTTLDGANAVLQSDLNAEELVHQVASKGGTTEAGLKILEKHKIKEMFIQVLRAAEKRAMELAE